MVTYGNPHVVYQDRIHHTTEKGAKLYWSGSSVGIEFVGTEIQGQDSAFYLPSLVFKKSFLNNNLQVVLQWQNIDMGLLKTNEQRITTFKPNAFFTTTNYIHEVDMVVLNLIYNFNSSKKKTKFIDSEFGKSEF